MKYAEHISNLRHAIKEVSDESDFSDSYLYSLWKLGRANFLSQKAKRKDHIGRSNWHTFCIELEAGKSHDCTCVPVGCQVLKSVYEVPGVIASRVTEYLTVLTLDGTPIPYRTEAEKRTSQYDPIKKDKLGYMLYNRKLVIWDDNLSLKAVQCRGLFADPLAWQDIQLCTDTNPCVDVYNLDSGLTEDDEALIIPFVLNLVQVGLTRAEDTSSDTNPEIR